MAESTQTHTSQPQPEDMHWAVAYLREDLQDIRNETRGLHERIDDARAAATSESRELQKRIEDSSSAAAGERRDLHNRIDETTSSLNASMNARFDVLSARLDSHFRWTMMAMVGMAGLLSAMMKL